MATTLAHIVQRRKTAAAWTSSNEVLLGQEFGVESDTNKFKIGDGTTPWTSLGYQAGSAASLAATYAPLPGAVKNALTGWYHVRAYGADPTGSTDCTTIVNNLVTAVLAAGGGVVYFDGGTATNPNYLLDHIAISKAGGRANIELRAAPDTYLIATASGTTDFISVVGSTTSTSQFVSRIRLRDLIIKAAGSGTGSFPTVRRPSRGIVLTGCQDVTVQNVKIIGFQNGALVLTDVWDSYFTDVEIQWSGYATDATNYAYAVQLLGNLDCSNNNRFTNLHLEHCLLELLFDNLARENSFVDTKIEQGDDSDTNGSTLSPIYFKNAIENMFLGGFLAANKSDNIYRIRSDNNTATYLSTNNIAQAARFSNMLFTANSSNKARWFFGYRTHFEQVTVNRANGATGAYAFDFSDHCTFRGGSITMADNGSNFFNIRGNYNVIDAPTLFTSGDGAAASTQAIQFISGTSIKNLVRDYQIVGSIGSEFAAASAFGTAGTLGSNIVTNARDNNSSTSGGGQKNALHREYLKLTDSTAATYTALANGYTGQRIALTAVNGGVVTLQHGTAANSLLLKTGTNRTLAAGETVNLINVDGTWKEFGEAQVVRQIPTGGKYVYTSSPTAPATTNSAGVGTFRAVPWYVPAPVTLASIGAEVTAAGDAGSKVRLGIYADNGSCYPGALVLDAGQIAGDSVAVQEIATTQVLPAGLYWVGAVVQAVTTTQPTVRSVGPNWSPPAPIPAGTTLPTAGQQVFGLNQTGTTGALPGTFTTTVSPAAGNVPRVFVKIA